jgi:hypothetical protein
MKSILLQSIAFFFEYFTGVIKIVILISLIAMFIFGFSDRIGH